MKKTIVLVIAGVLVNGFVAAQSVQTNQKDTTAKTKGKANDRIRNAGPVNGWKSDTAKNKTDSIQINKNSIIPGRQKNQKNKVKVKND